MKPHGLPRTDKTRWCWEWAKGSRSRERRAAVALADEQRDAAAEVARLERVYWLECDSFDFDVLLTERGTAHRLRGDRVLFVTSR